MAHCPSKLSILNETLVYFGLEPEATSGGKSVQAKRFNTFYDTALGSLLSLHTWSFAIKSELASPVADEEDSYHFPADMERLIGVFPSQVGNLLNDELAVAYSLEGTIIKTYTKEPVIKYIARVDEGIFPNYFVDVLVARLRHQLARSFTEDETLINQTSATAEMKLEDAICVDMRATRAFSPSPGKNARYPIANASYNGN